MNKKANTVLFILLATLVNLIIMIVLFLICLAIMVNFTDPESSLVSLYIGLIFIVSIGGSFFLYTLIMKKVIAKFDLEKYLSPIFAKKITIKDECWLATDVFVAPGITIEHGTVVSSRSSVYKEIPANKVCFGNPAKIIKNTRIKKDGTLTS